MSGDIACHSCDLMVSIAPLKHGDNANCPRCGGFLTRFREDTYQRVLAFASSGLIFLLLANSYSFLSFSVNGISSNITLRETPIALWQNGMPEVALLVTSFIIVIPAVVLVMLLALCVPLSQRQYRYWLPHMAKGVVRLQNWAMVEVFIIGVIVSLVKLSEIASVVLGVSFWTYVAFSICFIVAVASLDRYQCWEDLEHLQGQQAP
ncbi:MAG: paraquat-inducible protein A [Halioglobus sp.]|jgi:paraquat-inducible protein A